MVQIGNLHIVKAASINPPSISIVEASCLWDFLVSRYKCLEETKIYLSISKDVDFKTLLKTGIVILLEKQIKLIEKEMEIYKIPMPDPPPISFDNLVNSGIEIKDEFIFRQLFEGCQSYIDFLARISRSIITSDPLRDIFIDFLKQDILLFDQLCKYGKAKGWLQVAPMYNAH